LKFKSPSNVDGFLIENQFPSNAKIIAWGNTTEKCLNNKGYLVWKTLLNSTVDELVEILKK
jgi:hypothetical protein